MSAFFLRLLARLPLGLLHALGWAAGWGVYGLSHRYRARLRENLAASGLGASGILRRAVAEAGKGVLELPAI